MATVKTHSQHDKHGFTGGAAQGGECGRTAFWYVMTNNNSVQAQELQVKVHPERFCARADVKVDGAY